MEGSTLIIQGKHYTEENLYQLPESINGFNATSRKDAHTLVFFRELNGFSNFHPSNFEYSGIMYHSSEQLIQYMKVIYFNDEDTASAILKSDTPLDCKQLSKTSRT